MDDLREVVKVNDEGSAVSGGNKGVDEHECLVKLVSVSEPRERHGGQRRLDLLELVDLVLLLELLCRRVHALVEVRRRQAQIPFFLFQASSHVFMFSSFY